MKKKTVKVAAVAELKESDTKEADAVARDGKSEAETVSSESAVIPSKQTNAKKTRGISQQFLDLFWKLADSEASNRLAASLEIIKHVDSAHSSESQLTYTVGRLVQGLASNRECARHGYYITLVGILKALDASRLPNQILHDAIKNKLDVEGSKKERIDQHVGLILAYGALLKSGRLTGTNDMVLVINQLISGSKIKNYIQPVAFGFLEELCQQVDSGTFKGTVWPLLKPELALTWEQQTFDTLNLLLFAQNKFAKVVKNSFWKENLGFSSISDPECFSELTKLILRHSSPGEHPVFARIANSLTRSGKLLDFWTEHFDPALESPTKTKSVTALTMLMSVIKVVDNETVGKLLQKNIVSILIEGLQVKDELNIPSAEKALDSIKNVLAKEDVTPEAQISIIEQLLNSADNVAFDKNTNTRFVATVNPSLKKEAVVRIVDIYRQFVNDSSRTQDRITIIQQLAKLINHPTMQREVEWKASQLVFLATWAYFTPSSSKIYATAAKETFHRALDNPCKKLEDLSAVLSKTFDQVNKLVPGSGISDEVKSHWNNLQKGVQKIQKKNRSTKQVDSWTSQVFLVLYLNMGFELLRDSALPAEIIAELDTCYTKATEKESKKSKVASVAEDPHWLEVVTDILLSLLSRNQHLLRSIVVSVWSLLAEHITPDALQQVLDVIDPSKKDMPLVDADDEEEDDDSAESELSEEEDAAEEEAEAAEESDGEDEFSDEMDEEETITDKLRMKIHEALGDSAALTDTESVDIDDLSDGQMESLDKALGSAFQEFRKARPVRKNNNKLPKDQTALMHFRLRCLDLIEVLTDKELSISLSAAAMMPLLSLLEVTVKEPLQKPLMDRTKSVLRKLTNIRRFSDSRSDVDMDDLVKLLQILFSKPYAKRALMPYIGEDLVLCCSFILRCTLHLSRVGGGQKKSGLANGGQEVEVDGVYQLYRSNLSKFFLKRDSPVPFGVFSRALVYPWPDAGLLLEPLIEYAFGPAILKNRKLQAVQLLTALFRNSTALSAVGQPLLTKRLHSLLQSSQRVVDEAGADSKPKYLNELFILLRVVHQCPELKGLPADGGTEVWEPFKASLAAFTAKGLGKQKDLKKSHLMLARLLGLDVDETITAVAPKQTAPTNRQSNEVQANVVTTTTTTKKTKSKRPGDKEKKEAKKRRMAASAQGFVDVTFTQVDMTDAGEAETETTVAQEHAGQRKMKGDDTNGNQVDDDDDDDVVAKSNKKKKKKKKGEEEEEEETGKVTEAVTRNKKRRNKESVAQQESSINETPASSPAISKKKKKSSQN